MEQAESMTRRRSRLATDLTLLAVIGVLLLAALGAGGMTLYQQFYGPSAFVTRYLDLLANGDAADALRVPGVAVDRATLTAAGIDQAASEALLRRSTLASLTDIEVVSEETVDEHTTVSVSYKAGGHPGTTSFVVEQDGWVGVTPNWRFTRSPLAAIELTIRGVDQFAVNGFAIDRRQVVLTDENSTSLGPIPLLVLTPGVYSVTVDTAIATSPGVSILADSPLMTTPIDLQPEPTKEFVQVVQTRVEEFLTECTTQEVLQPTACPFGLSIDNRVVSAPKWSIATQPTVAVAPDGAQWKIPPTGATAHIDVEVQSLFDGKINELSEDVPFTVNGTIAILPDGSASIRVGTPET